MEMVKGFLGVVKLVSETGAATSVQSLTFNLDRFQGIRSRLPFYLIPTDGVILRCGILSPYFRGG